MKSKTKAILKTLVFTGMLVAADASAQTGAPWGGIYVRGDMIVGFTTGSGNDLIVNLGQAANVLTNGMQWNLSSVLSGFNSGSLSSVTWGVIGISSNAPNTVFATYTGTGLPPAIPGLANFNAVKGAIGIGGDGGLGSLINSSSGYVTPPANTGGDGAWYTGTVTGDTGSYETEYTNPNGSTSGGLPSTINFYKAIQGGSVAQTGTFTINSSRILTFNTVGGTAPPPQITSITRVGNLSTVYFTTTNGSFTYTLFYTNSTGLTSAISSWPTNATTVTGNGLTNSISDTTTDPNRFYRVGVH
jgi:hypothetical protein